MSKTVGIQVRHGRSCPAGIDAEAQCKCSPSYRAETWDPRAGRKIRETFATMAAAKAWRADTLGEVRRGQRRAVDPVTVRQAGTAWLEAAEAGRIRSRSGDTYKPSALRGYRAALEGRIFDELGSAKLGSIRRSDVQDFADRLVGEGLDPSTVRNLLMPLRVVFRRALSRGEVAVNPTTGIELPAVRGRRDRIASPDEAAKLLAALGDTDRPLWATAMFAGLRRGELMALRFEDVDLPAGVIRVERSYDVKAGIVEPKSAAGRRTVPIPAVLREHLAAHMLRVGRREGFAFGRSALTPFSYSSARKRAATAWRRAELTAIGMHEARHTYASICIAAGVNAKALSTYLGHSSITITLDRYGHLMPGNEGEAAALIDSYIARASTEDEAATQ